MPDPPPAAIRVLLFAGLREAAGWGERSWLLRALPTTPRILWRELALPGAVEEVRVAINQRFATADCLLQAGDELAFLPPISGG